MIMMHSTAERTNRHSVVRMRLLGRRCDEENFAEEILVIDVLIKDGLLNLQHQSE